MMSMNNFGIIVNKIKEELDEVNPLDRDGLLRQAIQNKLQDTVINYRRELSTYADYITDIDATRVIKASRRRKKEHDKKALEMAIAKANKEKTNE